ncbi:class I adenylate-forming enzyme family protein [Microbacterium halotolerans]|uniref:class I adenylate-forming enzyme family protein n=1 Tax=Microbacterium halotolerans TaxID=246613 RepID=UPI0013C3443A|nr:AMP-binding protein [Microbacterium halotolerans]
MRQSISSIITDLARTDPCRVVVVDPAGELTARALDDASTRLAHAFRARGVDQDDLVMVSLPNGGDFVIACAAIWKAGATPQPVSTALTAAERTALERLSKPSASIGSPPLTPGIAWFGSVDAPPTGLVLPDLAATSWKAATTSGSTGTPKVVRSTAAALLDPTQPVAPFLPLRATQLVSGPMTHSATFTYAFRGLLTGHRLVILHRFDERAWLDAVEEHRITWALVVPTMMHRLLRLPPEERRRDRLRSVESLLHMGAPCAADLKRAFLDWVGAARVVEVYAGSESNGLTMIRGDEWLAHEGSVGRPIGGTEVQIRSAAGEAATGKIGVVWMRRGPHPSYEYIGAESRRDDAGWDTLGDLGHVDDAGYLYLHDREDDVINRGGEKIYPVAVEQVLESHPDVRSAVAFGIRDGVLGQTVAAVVDVGEAMVGVDDVAAWVRPRLGHRAPSSIEIVHEPIRNDAGKTSRHAWALRA